MSKFCHCFLWKQKSNNISIKRNLAFYGCRSLKEIVIPSSVTSIEQCAFKGCVSLQEIKIPSEIESIQEGAYLNCQLLKNVIFEENSKIKKIQKKLLIIA